MRKRRGACEAGMALSTVLALSALVMMTFMILTNLAIGSIRLTINGRDKAISLSMAEAGIDDSVDQLRLNNSYAGTAGLLAVGEGTFDVNVVTVNQNLRDVYSTGITSNGKRRNVRARVNLTGLAFGDGAMISNGDIAINGSVLVQTVPSNQRNAHVRANGSVSVVGATSVDGRIAAAGTVSMPYGSSSDSLYPYGQSGAARIPFPTKAVIKQWKQQWIANAQAGGTIGGINRTSATITGPKYINGDIILTSGDTVTINGTGPIYVNGSVTMRGSSKLINSSHLIVAGTFEQVGATVTDPYDPVYEADGSLTSTPPALIALSSNITQAVRLTGTATNNQFSVIYAVNGGIDVQGNVNVRGSLVAGGKGATITASGNYTHDYPKNAATSVRFANLPAVTSWIEM